MWPWCCHRDTGYGQLSIVPQDGAIVMESMYTRVTHEKDPWGKGGAALHTNLYTRIELHVPPNRLQSYLF